MPPTRTRPPQLLIASHNHGAGSELQQLGAGAMVMTRDEQLGGTSAGRRHVNILVSCGRPASDKCHAKRESVAWNRCEYATIGWRRYWRMRRPMTPAPVPITARAVGALKAHIHLRPLFTSARPFATSVSSLASRLSHRASDCARRVSHLLSSSERRPSHLAANSANRCSSFASNRA